MKLRGLTVLVLSLFAGISSANGQDKKEAEKLPGQLSNAELGKMIEAMGLKPKEKKKRFDFVFRATLNKEQWNLSMSAVMSTDGRSIWVMAWLDQLPKSAGDVPRTALLRLLADNDRLGQGKFFAYVAGNRRFVLQRVIPNYRITTAGFRYVLKDVCESVVATYAHWNTQNWKAAKPASAEK